METATNSASIPHIIRNSSSGFDVIRGSQPYNILVKLSEKAVRCFEVTPDGSYIIWTDDEFRGIKVVDLESLKIVQCIKSGLKPQHLKLSPLGSHLAIWFQYKSVPEGSEEPNMWIVDLKATLEKPSSESDSVDIKDLPIKARFVVKSNSRWCPEWSDDERISFRQFHSEIHCFEDQKFDRWIHKTNQIKVSSASIKRNLLDGKYYFATFTVGTKGQPSFVKIFRYPKSQTEKLDGTPLVSKSFFRGDSVKFIWSPIGSSLLLLCLSDTDKSGKSYYGTQMLHFLDLKGGNNSPQLNKEGPIHDVAWVPLAPKSKLSLAPNSKSHQAESGNRESYLRQLEKEQMYCVIYGYMPAKIGLFNLSGEIVSDFCDEVYSVNQISFNPFGNILITAGFGNLRGGIYVWDVSRKSSHVPPSGTREPSRGIREPSKGMKEPSSGSLPLIANFKCPETTNLTWSGDGMTLMTSTTAPRLRVGNGFKLWKYTGLLLHEDTSATSVEVYQVDFQPRPPGHFSEPILRPTFTKPVTTIQSQPKYVPPSQRDKSMYLKQVQELTSAKAKEATKTPKEEAEKKMKNLEKKLGDIQKLKKAQQSGKSLEKNQLEKITKETELIQELEYLKLHS